MRRSARARIERVVAGFNEAYALDRTHRTAHHGASLMSPATGPMNAISVHLPDGSPLRAGASAIVLETDGLRVTAIAVDHHPAEPAYGYRFDYAGRSVVFSGDTKRTQGLVTAGRSADLLVHGAQAKDLVEMMQAAAGRAKQTRLKSIFADIRTYHSIHIGKQDFGRMPANRVFWLVDALLFDSVRSSIVDHIVDDFHVFRAIGATTCPLASF